MSDVVHDLKTLKVSRERQLTTMFSRLMKIKVKDIFFRSRADTVEIGLGHVPDSGNLDDVRYPTTDKSIFINYYEVWRLNIEKSLGRLCRIYLHILTARNEFQEEPIFSLHCDPDRNKKDRNFVYTGAPHVHFSCSPYNLHRAHVPLCLSDSEIIYENAAEFWKRYTTFVDVIGHEVLPNFTMRPL